MYEKVLSPLLTLSTRTSNPPYSLALLCLSKEMGHFQPTKVNLSRIFISSLVYLTARLHQVTKSWSALVKAYRKQSAELWSCFGTLRLIFLSFLYASVVVNSTSRIHSGYRVTARLSFFLKGAYVQTVSVKHPDSMKKKSFIIPTHFILISVLFTELHYLNWIL